MINFTGVEAFGAFDLGLGISEPAEQHVRQRMARGRSKSTAPALLFQSTSLRLRRRTSDLPTPPEPTKKMNRVGGSGGAMQSAASKAPRTNRRRRFCRRELQGLGLFATRHFFGELLHFIDATRPNDSPVNQLDLLPESVWYLRTWGAWRPRRSATSRLPSPSSI